MLATSGMVNVILIVFGVMKDGSEELTAGGAGGGGAIERKREKWRKGYKMNEEEHGTSDKTYVVREVDKHHSLVRRLLGLHWWRL